MKLQHSFDVPDEVGAEMLPNLIAKIRDAQPDSWTLHVAASRPEPLLEAEADKTTVVESLDGSNPGKQAASVSSTPVEANEPEQVKQPSVLPPSAD
jgi:hypothetical protein